MCTMGRVVSKAGFHELGDFFPMILWRTHPFLPTPGLEQTQSLQVWFGLVWLSRGCSFGCVGSSLWGGSIPAPGSSQGGHEENKTIHGSQTAKNFPKPIALGLCFTAELPPAHLLPMLLSLVFGFSNITSQIQPAQILFNTLKM